MNVILTPQDHSNQLITVTLSSSDYASYMQKTMVEYQKDFEMQGYRKGKVPLEIVQKNVNPQGMTIMIFEHIVNDSINQVLKEHPTHRRIGEPYGMDTKTSDDGTMLVTYLLDTYPDVQVLNDNYKTLEMQKTDTNISEEELDQSILMLQKQYATYELADTIQLGTSSRIQMQFLDASGVVLDTGSLYVNDEDFAEHAILKDTLIGHHKGDIINLTYDHDALPHVMHYHKDDRTPIQLALEVIDIQVAVLPTRDEATITKLFGNEDITTIAQVRSKISSLLSEQKTEQQLTTQVDGFVSKARDSFVVAIPQTIITSETKSRLDSMYKKFGGEDKMKTLLNEKSPGEYDRMVEEVSSAAKESLEKYFVFQKITEVMELKDINREKELDAERKLYEKLIK